MKILRLLLAVAAGLPTAARAGDPKLSDFAGVWRGTGVYERQASSVSSGKLTCKLTITAASDDDITVNGRCAAPEGSQGFRTRITAGGGSLTGTDGQTGRLSKGTLSAAGISLAGHDTEGDTTFALSTPSANGMRWRSSSKDARESRSADVTLKK